MDLAQLHAGFRRSAGPAGGARRAGAQQGRHSQRRTAANRPSVVVALKIAIDRVGEGAGPRRPGSAGPPRVAARRLQHFCHCQWRVFWNFPSVSVVLKMAFPSGLATALRFRLVLTEKIAEPPHADHTADAGETKNSAA